LSEDHNHLTVDINLIDPEYYTFSLNVLHSYVRADDIDRDTTCVLN